MIQLTGNHRKFTTIFFLYALSPVIFSNEANILGIFPTPSYSHQEPLMTLSKSLASKGHNVTVLTTHPSKEKVINLKEIDLRALSEKWNHMTSSCISLHRRYSNLQFVMDMVDYLKLMTSMILENKEFKRFLREANGTKYDVILYESLAYSALLGIGEVVGNPPVVGIVTLPVFVWAEEPMGNPASLSFAPIVVFEHDDKMTSWERLKNVFGYLYSSFVTNYFILPMQQQLLEKYFSSVKRTAKELEYNKSLLIVTTDLSTTFAKPLQPNSIYVGPIQLQGKPNPLPKDLQDWMDGAEEGVIYFSLGNNMKGICVPDNIRDAFVRVFNQYPKVRVLWKWEADTKLPDQPVNVLVSKWFPQKSVLAHPKVKVFISQVGLQSFQEAIQNALPILGIPIFGDQYHNAKKLLNSGAGLKLDFLKVTFEELSDKLKSILTNSSYKNNMLRLQSIMRDKPMTSIDTAIWWIEYVVRHNGAPHLRPEVLDLSWYQYYEVDILLVVFSAIFATLFLIYFVAKSLAIRLTSGKVQKFAKIKKN